MLSEHEFKLKFIKLPKEQATSAATTRISSLSGCSPNLKIKSCIHFYKCFMQRICKQLNYWHLISLCLSHNFGLIFTLSTKDRKSWLSDSLVNNSVIPSLIPQVLQFLLIMLYGVYNKTSKVSDPKHIYWPNISYLWW